MITSLISLKNNFEKHEVMVDYLNFIQKALNLIFLIKNYKCKTKLYLKLFFFNFVMLVFRIFNKQLNKNATNNKFIICLLYYQFQWVITKKGLFYILLFVKRQNTLLKILVPRN